MNSDISNVIDSIEKACDDIGELDLSGIKLENPEPVLLNAQEGNFDEHVAMQPAAIAYYGMLMKTARRQLNATQRAYEHWKKKTFRVSKDALSQPVAGKPAPKSTIADVESYMLINHEKDIEVWENDIEILQSKYDVIESWYDAWKQKGFSLKEIGSEGRDEKYSKSYMYSNNESNELSDSKPINNFKTKSTSTKVSTNDRQTAFDRIKKIQRDKNKEG